MRSAFVRDLLAAAAATAYLTACGGSNGALPPISAAAATVRVRFVEAAPLLEALVNGVPTGLGSTAYLTVDGATTSSQFPYAYVTSYSSVRAGTQSIEILDELGYSVGPLQTHSLAAGKQYTIAVLGSYPNYKAVAFEDPAASSSAQLSLYEAASATASADFGRFQASTHSKFVKLGSAAFGSVATVTLGSSVTNFGGYAGRGVTPFGNQSVVTGALTLESVDPFDLRNALPFHNAGRMSLFVLDPSTRSNPPNVIGSLDI